MHINKYINRDNYFYMLRMFPPWGEGLNLSMKNSVIPIITLKKIREITSWHIMYYITLVLSEFKIGNFRIGKISYVPNIVNVVYLYGGSNSVETT